MTLHASNQGRLGGASRRSAVLVSGLALALVAGAMLALATIAGQAPATVRSIGIPGEATTLPPIVVSSAPPAVGAAGTTLDVDDRVAFWQARLAAAPDEYLGALHLVDALLDRTRATGSLSDLERAAIALERAAARAPSADAGLPLREGHLAFALHDFEAAGEAAARALALDPGDAAALALLGDAALESGDYEAAAESYAALEAEGRTAPILSRLGRMAWLTGDPDRAEALLVEAVSIATGDGLADRTAFHRFQLAELLRGRNELDAAAREYLAALEAAPGHVPSLGGLAFVREAQGRRPDAIRLLESATARLPSPDLVAALGDLRALAGEKAEAAEAWALVERIAEVARATGAVYDRQLVLFLADHDRDASTAVSLAEAELAERTDVYGYDALAWALYRAGRLAEADAAAAEALRLGTPDGRLLYHAGLIAQALGREADARQLLGRAAASSAALPPLQVPALDAALERLGE
jgi:tetratricopeptide (TPR) repeat protein